MHRAALVAVVSGSLPVSPPPTLRPPNGRLEIWQHGPPPMAGRKGKAAAGLFEERGAALFSTHKFHPPQILSLIIILLLTNIIK